MACLLIGLNEQDKQASAMTGAEGQYMTHKILAASLIAAVALTLPASSFAQESHEDAVAQTHRHDARHHTKAKFVGGGAVGGALIGAKVGGPVGALVGAGVGAGAGLAGNSAYHHHEVKHREHHATPYHHHD